MSQRCCRVCQQPLFEEVLLSYQNMPKSAQFFPKREDLADEKGADLDICQCSGCGLVQLVNEPVFYFRDVIRAAAVSEEMTQFRKKQFQNWIEQYLLQNKKIIEIGAGSGEYLNILNQCDITAIGLENAADSVGRAIENGLNVYQGFVSGSDYQIPEAPFGGFVMLNFLEHLPEPVEVLKGIWLNLESNAIGLVEVPNFDMIIRNKLFSEFISDHLFYFTQQTFNHVLEMSGFTVLACSETWHDYSLSAVVQKRDKLDLSVFKEQKSKLSDALKSYINRFEKSGVAIWGAGHQALAVISLTGIAERIEYVIDSAPFKQNCYTPATHIPIVPPEHLRQHPVGAVIVMAASYSDEVSQILCKDYPGINIAVLRDDGLEYVK